MLHLPYTPNEKADQRKGSDTGLVGVTDSASAWEAGMGPKWIDLYENLQLEINHMFSHHELCLEGGYRAPNVLAASGYSKPLIQGG